MQVTRLLCLGLMLGAFAFPGAARCESAALAKFKTAATTLVDAWLKQIAPSEKELAKAYDDLEALKKKTPPPADLDKQARGLQLQIEKIKASVRYAADTAKTDYGVLTIASEDAAEVKEAEGYVIRLLSSKGLMQNKYIGFKMTQKSDTAGKVKTTSFTFAIDFRI